MAKSIEFLDAVPADFQTEYVAKRRPLAIRAAAKDWPAVNKWTPAYLKKKVGKKQISQASLDHEEVHEFSFGEYLDLLDEPVEEVGVLPYIRNKFLHDLFPELSKDLGKLAWLGETWVEREPFATLVRAMRPNWFNWAEFFICQKDVRYPVLHTDNCMLHAWSVQIYGIKRYWVWPLIPGFKDRFCIGEDLDTFLGVEPWTIEIGPGDAVVIPAGLPHVAETLTTSITISGSYVEETNWVEFSREFCDIELMRDMRAA